MNASNQNATRVLHLFKTATVTFALAGVTAMFAFAPSARADAPDSIAKSGVVRIGVFEDYPPFGSIGPDMKPQGYDIDVANLIGKSLNAKVELVQVTGDNRMAYLADHKADMLLSVGQTPERGQGDRLLPAIRPVLPRGIRPEDANREECERPRRQDGFGRTRHARRPERHQGRTNERHDQAF